jgi:hypothetical protein
VASGALSAQAAPRGPGGSSLLPVESSAASKGAKEGHVRGGRKGSGGAGTGEPGTDGDGEGSSSSSSDGGGNGSRGRKKRRQSKRSSRRGTSVAGGVVSEAKALEFPVSPGQVTCLAQPKLHVVR